eukprot:TRINITY_DN157983_c0_g2_i1.p1 TRINITY_DN157983_c0_g2~~TRINITY_DN157983_c0_g2_i1.p1  ORF type:complete len:681 (-),score=227.61 TRINITY_DN157983_c0_g2_i1:171-2213(-)
MSMDGVTPIKSEYIIEYSGIEERQPQKTVDDRDVEEKSPEMGETEQKGKQKKSRKRKRDDIGLSYCQDEQLCKQMARNGVCNFGEKCKFRHDIDEFLSTKKPDIADKCPLYEKFGWCPSALNCRMVMSHLDKSGEKPKSAEKEEKKEIPSVNVVKMASLRLLRKKRNGYKFETKYPKEDLLIVPDYLADRFLKIDELKETKESNESNESVNKVESQQETGDISKTEDTVKTEEKDVKIEEKDVKTEEKLDETKEEEMKQEEEIIEKEKPIGPLFEKEKKKIDWKNKIVISSLTTVGNLPFRRICKDFKADITISEMVLASQILKGQNSDLALLRRHPCEDVFGIQLTANNPVIFGKTCEMLTNECEFDFIDVNCGCPINQVCDRGMGAMYMTRPRRLHATVLTCNNVLNVPLTFKLRTGIDEGKNTTHRLLQKMQIWGGVDAVFLHGRTRAQRYTRSANWDYIANCATIQTPELPQIPIIGNGDIMGFQDWDEHLAAQNGAITSCMLGRGALIKPWLCTEIKEQRDWDISASERLGIFKDFVSYGFEQWGSDQMGVNKTRRFLLEWMSFTHRYVPVGIMERLPQRLNDRPPLFTGRNDLETLLSSKLVSDWIKVSEMLLGPVKEGFRFEPKHKSNSFKLSAEEVHAMGMSQLKARKEANDQIASRVNDEEKANSKLDELM